MADPAPIAGAKWILDGQAIDYSLKRWTALAHYIGDAQVPIDNNWIETASGPLRRAGRTGYSPAACVPANGRPPS
ncbi:MAG: transposase [Betaproteobacteria bacterium]|nr:transposase [Candidatus Dechloromonas phosphorivorans]